MAEITMSPEQFRELKDLHKQAVKDGAETFFFHGNELVTHYAKYLIESLEVRMEGK